MEAPIESNGYKKYIIQVGWFNPQPNLLFAVLAQEVLTKSKKDGEYLMKLLYPQSLGVGLPYLCPIVGEMTNEDFERLEEEADMDEIERQVKQSLPKFELPQDFVKKIDLMHPN